MGTPTFRQYVARDGQPPGARRERSTRSSAFDGLTVWRVPVNSAGLFPVIGGAAVDQASPPQPPSKAKSGKTTLPRGGKIWLMTIVLVIVPLGAVLPCNGGAWGIASSFTTLARRAVRFSSLVSNATSNGQNCPTCTEARADAVLSTGVGPHPLDPYALTRGRALAYPSTHARGPRGAWRQHAHHPDLRAGPRRLRGVRTLGGALVDLGPGRAARRAPARDPAGPRAVFGLRLLLRRGRPHGHHRSLGVDALRAGGDRSHGVARRAAGVAASGRPC